ncbi:hypothetical protein L7F22_009118 [Adiantum nelumboides]|nr:hypothetical protein [Adiantum nelumboides]
MATRRATRVAKGIEEEREEQYKNEEIDLDALHSDIEAALYDHSTRSLRRRIAEKAQRKAQRSIGMSPFKALYGQECIAPLNFSDPTVKVEAFKQMLDEMEAQTKAIRKDIQAAQDRQKHNADKDRSERTFKLGNRVFLRIKPKRSNLSLGKFKKLSPRYCGPYEIVKVISDQAYRLRLPPNLKVHDVFYVSLLKPYVPNPEQILDVEQIVVPAQGILELQPDYILEMRERKLRNRSIIKHLVKWKDFPKEDATWEDEITLQRDYPDISLRRGHLKFFKLGRM